MKEKNLKSETLLVKKYPIYRYIKALQGKVDSHLMYLNHWYLRRVRRFLTGIKCSITVSEKKNFMMQRKNHINDSRNSNMYETFHVSLKN